MQDDRVGLGWRPELAAGIFDALDEIDVLEVIADNHLEAGRRHRQALQALARQVPLHVHSIALGLAGAEEVSGKRLDRVARLVNEVEPEAWSEHLRLYARRAASRSDIWRRRRAARRRSQATARNLRKARDIVGSTPLMENIATLLDPPCSTLSEQRLDRRHRVGERMRHWCSTCTTSMPTRPISAFDPLQFLSEIPLARVGCHPHRGRRMDQRAGRRQAISARRSSARGDGPGLRIC